MLTIGKINDIIFMVKIIKGGTFMKKFIIKSNLLILSVMVMAIFIISGFSTVNAATTTTTTITIDLPITSGVYYFYPEGYLTKNANNELEKVKNTTKKTERLTGKEFEITIDSSNEYKYKSRTMREVTYNGEKGYINVNTLKYELVKKEETKTIDLSNVQGTYYFYPEGYLEKGTYSRLRKVENTTMNPEELTGKKFEIKTVSEKKYKYNFRKMYEVIYNGQKGFINVNVLDHEVQPQVEVHKIDFSKTLTVHRFYLDTYLEVKEGTTELVHINGSKDTPTKLEDVKEVKFYTDTEYTLKTKNGTYKLYKAEIDGKTGYVNVKLNNSRFFI